MRDRSPHPSNPEDVIRRLESAEFHEKIARSLFRRYPFHEEAVIDAVTDAIQKMVDKRGVGVDFRNLEGYAFRVALHTLRRHVRDVQRRAAVEHQSSHPEDGRVEDPSETAENAELLAKLPDLISKLPPQAQAIVRLHFYQEMPVVDIAKQLDISRSGAFAKLSVALKLLRSWML